MKKALPLLLLLAVITASCKNTWNDNDKKALYQACSEEAANAGTPPEQVKPYCDCVIKKILAKYPDENDAMAHKDSVAKDPDLISCRMERDK